ncbi:MAG: hypothetical protein ACYTFA_17745, partial [Planctomycetota bacterium]
MGFKRTHRAVFATVSGLFAAMAAMATGILVWTDAHSVWAEPRDARSVCQTSVLVADDGSPGDFLGFSAAIGGDYAFLGALSGDTDTVHNCGTVYVFRRDGVSWVAHAELNASDATFLDEFGNSVSVGRDLLVVGAPNGEIPGTSNIGTVYVFKRNGQTWTEQTRLTAGEVYIESGARFGEAVAIDGDRVIVGAPDKLDITGLNEAGAVYFFERQGDDTWNVVGIPKAPATGDGDHLGIAVSISGDWAIAGAPRTDDECPLSNTCDSGSAFIFRYTGRLWVVHQTLAGINTAEGDQFGTSVAIHKDTVVVGAKDAKGGIYGVVAKAGAVYVFRRTDPNGTPSNLADDVWEEEQTLTNAVDGGGGDDLGQSVAIRDNTIIVGDNKHNAQRGEAYLFRHDGAEWLLNETLTSDDATALFFGWSVATNGDHVIAGAMGTDSAKGSAYAFSIWDCNGNGEPDDCDIHTDFGGTCVGAIIPDGPCEEDENGNGVPDTCDCQSDEECDDLLDCTTDSCNGVTGLCDNIPDPGWCAIGGACVPDGQVNSQNQCQMCDFGANPYDWSGVPGELVCDDDGNQCTENVCIGGVCRKRNLVSGTACGDTNPCTEPDACDGNGACVGLNPDCDDDNACTDDSCDTGSGCVHVDNTGPCDDHNACTEVDTCDGNGTCAPGDNPCGDFECVDDGVGGYDCIRPPPCRTSVLTAGDAEIGDLFGYSAAIGGDYAFLGALSGDTDTAFNCGAVYVFRRDGVSWAQHQELNASDAALFDEFGSSVSTDGDLLIVGAPEGEIPGTWDIGVAYIFKRNGQNWIEQAQLAAGPVYRENLANFGEAVALDADPPTGARLIVGAPDKTYDSKKTGEVYFFEQQSDGTWDAVGSPQAPTSGNGDKFGNVVGISGDWAIVGAPKTDDWCPLTNSCDSGSAFVYRSAWGSWRLHQKLMGCDTREGNQFG